MTAQSRKAKLHMRELDINSYVPLHSDVFSDDEYYVYRDAENNLEYVRRKIGSWVNVSAFFPLIERLNVDMQHFESELLRKVKSHKLNVPNPRYKGIWISLRDARILAGLYKIEKYVSPILSFERIALVQYSGQQFWEFFACSSYDMNIRILRDVNSGKINMKQVFVFYDKYKGKEAKVQLQERNFYLTFKEYPAEVTEKNDSTLCGGFWVSYNIVKHYCKKHDLWKKLKPIIDFDTSPDQSGNVIIGKNLGLQRRFWKTSSSNAEFFGFPKSFGGGNAPERPKVNINSKTSFFQVNELIEKKRIITDITEQHNSVNYTTYIVRRYSDGWINGSLLVRAGCLLKVRQLDFGKDDPVMVTLNEMYFRDYVQGLDCEPVVSSRASTLNGFWISGRDARSVFKLLMIEPTPLSKSVEEFLLQSNYDIEHDEDDEYDIDILKEDEFLKDLSTSTQNRNSSVFVPTESSDDEDAYESAEEDVDVVAKNGNGTGIHKIIEVEDNSEYNELFNEPYNSDIKEEYPSYNKIPQDRVQRPNNIPPNNQHLHPSMEHQGMNSQFEDYSRRNQNSQMNNIVLDELRDVRNQLEKFLLLKRHPNAVEDRSIKALLYTLEVQKAIDPKTLEVSMLESVLQKFKERFNVHSKRIDQLLTNWKNQAISAMPYSLNYNPAFSRRPEAGVRSTEYGGSRSAEHNQQQYYQYQNPGNRLNQPHLTERQSTRPTVHRKFPEAPAFPYGTYGPSSQSSASQQSPPQDNPSQPYQKPTHYTAQDSRTFSPNSQQHQGQDNQSKHFKERPSPKDPTQQQPFNKARKTSGNPYPSSRPDSNNRSFRPENSNIYKKPVNPPFNIEMQKLINEDDLTYSQLKLTINENEGDHVVKVDTGKSLTDILFNNEDVKRFRKLVHFERITKRREELLKRRKVLFTGLVQPADENDNNSSNETNNKVILLKD